MRSHSIVTCWFDGNLKIGNNLADSRGSESRESNGVVRCMCVKGAVTKTLGKSWLRAGQCS